MTIIVQYVHHNEAEWDIVAVWKLHSHNSVLVVDAGANVLCNILPGRNKM